MNDHLEPATLPPPTSSYVTTHCMTCKAGWTRRGRDGREAVVCLLDREAVWPEITDCDRYAPNLTATTQTAT